MSEFRGKILIIDDEKELLSLMSDRFAANGYDVCIETDRDCAFNSAKDFNPDVVILDIMMPTNTEGYEVFNAIRSDESTKDIPIIFLTRKTEERENALSLGAEGFVEKPYDSKGLLLEVDRVIAEGKINK